MILLGEHDEPSLAVQQKRRCGPSASLTSTPKNRVWGFENHPSGRSCSSPDLSGENATGSVQFSYEIASGRIEHYQYDPFGNVIAQSGSLQQNYQWSSKETDAGTGLVYYLYRFYNPSLGRWTNRDPIEEVGGINLYSFIGNDTPNRIDFLGDFGSPLTWGAIAGIIEEVAATYVAVNPPDWLVMYLTPKLLPAGLPRQFWNRAANGGGDLSIDISNESSWDNVVDRIKNSPEFKAAVLDAKKHICVDGVDNTGDHFEVVTFNADRQLALSIHGCWLGYNYEPHKLSFWITDTYNFDKKHMWKKCQDDGLLTPFSERITIPDEDFCCAGQN